MDDEAISLEDATCLLRRAFSFAKRRRATRCFTMASVPKSRLPVPAAPPPFGLRATFAYGSALIQPGQAVERQFTIYAGPTQILGEPIYRRVADIPGPIDIVNVFRRSRDVGPHVDDILAKQPKAVWLQVGIRDDDAAERWARAGIDVIQDRCLMVELRGAGLRPQR